MQRANHNVLLVALCLTLLMPAQFSRAGASVSELHAEQWDLAREGERLLKMQGLLTILKAWSRIPDQVIEIRYPGGEEGEIWVHELVDWLVSLGVPSNNMTVVPGSGTEDVIHFALQEAGD